MTTSHLVAAAILSLYATATLPDSTAADNLHGGRPPSAGDASSREGGTGSKSMMEGVHAGAPGNIVTAAEGSVMTGNDVDADGYVSKKEAAKNGELAKQFDKLDRNRDGKLDESEFGSFTPSTSDVTGTAPVHSKDAADKQE